MAQYYSTFVQIPFDVVNGMYKECKTHIGQKIPLYSKVLGKPDVTGEGKYTMCSKS